jgi:transcriptional regulator with XRE-family HTH domain
MESMIQAPGQALRQLREALHLSLRDVEKASAVIAEHLKEPECVVVPSRLSDMETKNVAPNIQRLCSLALIYRVSVAELLSIYGIDMDSAASALVGKLPLNGHNGATALIRPPIVANVDLPALESVFTLTITSPIKRFIEQWGAVPLSYLKSLASDDYLYMHIGNEDLMMYPMLRPGAFVQVDKRLRRIKASGWSNDYDRPIYAVELREGHACCWCSQPRRDQLILQPHPHSTAHPIMLRYPEDAEILGTVVGFAMRLSATSG